MSVIMASSVVQGPENCIVLFRRMRLIQRDTKRAAADTRCYNVNAARHRRDTLPRHHWNRARQHINDELCKGTMMKKFRKQLLIGIAALGISAGAIAAHADCDGMPPDHASGGDHQKFAERMNARMAKHQAELHDKLKLNATQETACRQCHRSGRE